MVTDAMKCLIVVSAVVGSNVWGWAQDFDPGKAEFQSSCATCHGIDGKGKGPLSAQLKVAPADLTGLAKKNDGVFPLSNVYEIIDGRKVVIAHSTRDMPIWGDRYTPDPRKGINPNPSDKFGHFSYSPEVAVRSRILALIGYLSRIQEK